MKAKDLMIGDWVYDTILKGNTKVEMLSLSGIRGEFHEKVWNENTFEPIPLTPEILDKNGWECFDTYHKYSHYRHPKAPFGILRRKEGGYTIEFRDESGGLVFLFILYVHQLQHALRLCGIEKEIEL